MEKKRMPREFMEGTSTWALMWVRKYSETKMMMNWPMIARWCCLEAAFSGNAL